MSAQQPNREPAARWGSGGAYPDEPLAEAALARTWTEQFLAWQADAVAAGIVEPEAMALATSSVEGQPSLRTVLLKGVDERGFEFFTNYRSRKARELQANPRGALMFPWYQLHRQVLVTGTVVVVEPQRSDEYFAGRPYGSQIAAYASRQSAVISSRAELDAAFARAQAAHPAGAAVPRPAWWGGLRLAPETVEFWQGRRDRLHDRLRYRRPEDGGGAWAIERLSP